MARNGVPGWYWLVAVAALLFEGLLAYAFYLQLTTDPTSLALDQRALYEATPIWVEAANGLAVAAGVLGAIGLLQKKKFAKGALLLSLVAFVLQFAGSLLVPMVRQSTSSDELLGPVVILLLAYGFWQFAKIAYQREWIR